ncbi:hypothetical protein QE152_g36019 [Popillia japonica]|uniref:Uncharacterized protein n=1 Tax=Popillia japonica TaxID=7064 RepID=A0AAW1IE92_POPJA
MSWKWRVEPEKYANFKDDIWKQYNPSVKQNTAQEKISYVGKLITDTTNRVFKIQKEFTPKSKQPPPWWDEECTRVIQERRKITKYYKANRTLDTYIKYQETIAYSKRFLKQKKRYSWRKFCGNLNKEISSTEIWRTIRKFNRSPYQRMNSSYRWMPEVLEALCPAQTEEKEHRQEDLID